MGTTPLYPTFEKRIGDAIEQLIIRQVTPWSFMAAGPPFRVKYFDGREIAYQHVLFDGSPRAVFWGRYIEPFLEHLCVGEIGAVVKMANERDVEGRLLLPEVRELLLAGVKKVYARMADVDRRLRGRGFPDSVAPRSVAFEVQRMERFIDDRVQAELMMWKSTAKPWLTSLEKWCEVNKGLLWLLGALLSILALLPLVF